MENNTEIQFNLQIKYHYFTHLQRSSLSHFLITVIKWGYVRREQDSGDRVCSHRTYRATMAGGPPLPGVLSYLPHHHGGQPGTDGSYLEGCPSSHTHVLVPRWFSFCRCLHFNFCNSQDAGQFLRQDCNDIPGWVHHPILFFCFQRNYRMFPTGSYGLWPLCSHM